MIPADVTIEREGTLTTADTISSLGDDVWQANVLLDHRPNPAIAVRLRLGEGAWSEALPVTGIA